MFIFSKFCKLNHMVSHFNTCI